MTRLQAVGVLLIVLGLLYALMYAGWLRRARRNPSAAIATRPQTTASATTASAASTSTLSAATASANTSATSASASTPSATTRPGPARVDPTEPGRPVALPVVKSEGTYISTTTASSRLERVTTAGLGVRAAATMVVGEGTLRWERQGADDVRVAGDRLLRVSLERGMAGKFVGQARIVVVSWHTDEGDRYATGFLPRRRADVTPLVEAVQQLIQAQPIPDGTP